MPPMKTLALCLSIVLGALALGFVLSPFCRMVIVNHFHPDYCADFSPRLERTPYWVVSTRAWFHPSAFRTLHARNP